MNKKDFFNKVITQGYIDKGETFEGTSNLDEGFSEYIESVFYPWYLCRSLDNCISSGAYVSSKTYLDILCYKTKDYLVERENLLVERDSDVSKIGYKYSFDNYATNDFAIFARHRGITGFLGIYAIDSQMSVDTNKLTYKKISNRLYIDYSENRGVVYIGKYRGINAESKDNSVHEKCKITYIDEFPIDLNFAVSKEYSAIIDLSSQDYEELHSYIAEKRKHPFINAPYIRAVVNQKIAQQVENETGNAQNYNIMSVAKLNK